MVYKRYIKRGGKRFGPYYYESYRDKSGKVVSRFVSGPETNNSSSEKKNSPKKFDIRIFLVILGVIFIVTLLLLIGNLYYNTQVTGRVIDLTPSFGEMQIAEQIADNSITSNVDVRDSVDLSISEVSQENNKIMEFSTPSGKIELNFDLLNYSEFVKSSSEDNVLAEDFNITVNESREKYKWGYNVKLADLNFIARIDVTSNQTIKVIDNQTLRIGEAYLSFADLASQGYTLSINSPVLLNESLFVNETIVINETNVTEMNSSNITEVVTNISTRNESSGEIINITNETIVISNESESGENISVGNESVENVTVGNETDEVVLNESAREDSFEYNNSEVLMENTPEENALEEINETPFQEPVQEVLEPGVTGNVVNFITGFVIQGIRIFTGNAILNESENTVSVYIQRNFNEAEYNVGDTINLDPSLVFIEQSITYDLCYQETANASTAGDGSCNLSYSGSYDVVDQWLNPANAYDGNWSSAASPQSTIERAYINYSIPSGATLDSLLRVKVGTWIGNGTNDSNYSLSPSCWASPLEIQIVSNDDGAGATYVYCKNKSNSTYIELGLVPEMQSYLYEEAMLWNISNNTQPYSIDSCQNISESGTYTLSQNLIGAQIPSTGCFNISVSNVTLDCQNHYILNTTLAKPGIYVGSESGLRNITIKNCNVSMKRFTSSGSYGVWFNRVNDSNIINNILDSNQYGIYLTLSSNNQLINNTADFSNYGGINLDSSSNNQLINNTADSNYDGIKILSESRNISLYGNNMDNNSGYNFLIYNYHETINMDSSNIIDYAYRVYFNRSLFNYVFDSLNYSDAGFIYCINCNNITIKNLNISHRSKEGVYFYNVSNSIINNLTSNSNSYGVYLESGSNNNLFANSTFGSNSYGIYLNSSLNNTLINNTFSTGSGIYLGNSTNNTISLNNLNDGYGVYLESGSNNNQIINNNATKSALNNAFYLSFSSNNNLTGNNVSFHSNEAIRIQSNSSNNYLIGNNISLNSNGVVITSNNNQLINNIINSNTGSYGVLLASNLNTTLIGNTINLNSIGIRLSSANYSLLSRNTLVSNSYGISSDSSSSNLITDCINISSWSNNTRLYTNSNNNTFINCSYDQKEAVDNSSQLIRQWYYSAYVNDSFGNNLTGANLTAYNSSGDVEFSILTNLSGETGVNYLTEYVNNAGNVSYATPYRISVSKSGVGFAGKVLNVSSLLNILNDPFTVSYNLDSCGVIDLPGTYYLSSNLIGAQIPSTGCFNITASNVTLDCQNYYILNSTSNGTGIYVGSESGLTNVTVKNCNVTMNISLAGMGSTGGKGIFFYLTNNSIIINNTLSSGLQGILLSSVFNTLIENNTANLNDIGIMLISSSNNTLVNNTADFSVGAVWGTGIYLSSSTNNNLTFNNVNSNYYYGIGVTTGSSKNTFAKNVLGSNGVYGIFFQSNANNTLLDNIFNSNVGSAIYLTGSSNNTISNSSIWNCTVNTGCIYIYSHSNNNTFLGGVINLSSTNSIYIRDNSNNNLFNDLTLIGATNNDTYIYETSINNTFLNVTYNSSKEYVESGSSLIRKWYYSAYVNDSSGNVVDLANVTAYNNSNSVILNTLTNSSGSINISDITEYINSGNTSTGINRTYFNNHSFYARKSGVGVSKKSLNVTQNILNDIFTLSYNLTSCLQIDSPGIYTLTQNLLGAQIPVTGCFNITASNVILDCDNKYILNSSLASPGIYAGSENGLTNITVKNCNVTMSSGGDGIWFDKVNYSFILNNKAYWNNYGIHLRSSSNNLVANNSVNFDYSDGIYVNNSFNNLILENNATYCQFLSCTGITLQSSSNNTLFKNNASWPTGSGIYLRSSANNNLSNNFVIYSNYNGLGLILSSNNSLSNNIFASAYYYGVVLSGSDSNSLVNNTIRNCFSPVYLYRSFTLSNSSSNLVLGGAIYNGSNDLVQLSSNSNHNVFRNVNLSLATKNDTYLDSTSINNTFTNVSYTKEYVESGSSLIRKWYYKSYVNDTLGNSVNLANVTFYNNSDLIEFSALTNSSGWTNTLEVIEYINSGNTSNGINRTYATPHTIYGSKSGTGYFLKNLNFSSTLSVLNDTITLGDSLTYCTKILAPGVYNLSVNIFGAQIPTNGCFNITTSNVTLDCNGHYISNNTTEGVGIYAGSETGLTNITVKNCNVTTKYVNGYGIQFSNVDNSVILNNTLISNYFGISLLSDSNNNFVINNTASSNGWFGIYLSTSSNNNFTSNILNSNGYGAGIFSSSNNLFSQNNIYGCSTVTWACLRISNSSYNSYSNAIINISGEDLILVYANSSNNLFKDLILSGSSSKDVNISGNSINNTFINVSYSNSKENVAPASQLVRQWYYRAYVNHTEGGAVSNASVYAANSSWDYVFNTTTNSSGFIPVQTLTQYINNGTVNYVDFYMINATNITDSDGHYYNVSAYSGNNLNDAFTINDTTSPYFQGLVDTFVCEGNSLSLYFNVTDLGWDLPEAQLSPLDPFYPEVISFVNLTSSEQRIFSGILSKEDAGGVNARSKIYNETVTLFDGVNTNSTNISITVIETNEQPSMENFETTYNVIEGDRFYHSVLVNDTEDGNSSLGNLYFNMTGANFTDINSSGILNILTNSSIRGSYTIEVCATDKGLLNPHENISSVCLQDGTNKTECKSFILNIAERGTDTGNTGGGNGGGGGGGADTNSLNKTGDEDSDSDIVDVFVQTENPDNSSLSCSNWSKCNVIYGLTEVIEDMIFLKGEKTRTCLNLKTGIYETQRKLCNSAVNVTVKKSTDCHSDGITILDENKQVLSRLQLIVGEKNKLNIQFFLDKTSYCPYCYDRVKDYDETGIDCGGSCFICTENPIRVHSNLGNILFFIIMVGILLCGNIVILLIVRYYALKSEIINVRKITQ